MRFVLVASQEYKAAPAALKISYWMLSLIAITVLTESLLSGGLFGIAPQLSWGSGILGFIIAFIIFDTANTIVRKRKTARFLALLAGLASIVFPILAALESGDYWVTVFGLPGLILIALLNSGSSRRFFDRTKKSSE